MPLPDARRVLRPAAVLLGAVAMAGAVGCGRTVNRTAERRIRDALPTYIGPARVWRAHVDNPPERTIGGRIRSIAIDGEDVQLRQTITCAALHIDLRDVAVDTGRQRIKAIGSTAFRAAISEAGLNDYMVRTPPPPGDPVRIRRVRLRAGRMVAEGTRWMLGRAWPFRMTVEPRLVSARRLAFDPNRISVSGLRVPLPAPALRYIARKLDAGFDFAALPFPVDIRTFRVADGQFTVDGTADVMRSLNEEWAKRPG